MTTNDIGTKSLEPEERVGHGYYPLHLVFRHITGQHVTHPFEGWDVWMDNPRYVLFGHDNVCSVCGLIGVFFVLERYAGSPHNYAHFNLYGVDERNQEVRIDVRNGQPICATCRKAQGGIE